MAQWLERDRERLGSPARQTHFYLVLSHAQLGDVRGADAAFAAMRAAGAWKTSDCAPVNTLLEAVHGDLDQALKRYAVEPSTLNHVPYPIN